MPSGSSLSNASSAEPPAEDTKKINNRKVDWVEATGIVLGLIAGGVISLLLGALVIYWILGAVGLTTLTYKQIVGLLGIWEIVKPRSDSK